MKLNLFGHIAIPVGHHVTVTWYKELQSSFFGPSKEVELKFPLVVDVDTGIRYGHKSFYTDKRSFSPVNINIESHQLRSEVTPIQTIKGTVTACSIVPISDLHVETELHIEISQA